MCFFLLQNGCLCRFVASFRCWENGRNSKYRKHWNHHSSFFGVNFFSSRRFVAMFLVYEKMEEKDSRKISACMIFVIFLWGSFYFLWRSLFSMEIIALHCIIFSRVRKCLWTRCWFVVFLQFLLAHFWGKLVSLYRHFALLFAGKK